MNATDRRLGLRPDHGPADILSAEREEAGQDARADADGPEAHPPGRRFIVVEREPAIAKRHAVLKMNATDRRLGLRPDHGPADILSAEREEAGQDARADADGPEAHPPGHPFILVERDPAIAKRHAVLKMNATDRRLGLRPDHGPADILSAEREEAGQDALADADGPEAHPPGHRFIVVERDTAIAMTITTERVKRVAEGYTNTKGEAVPGLGGGFRYCQLGEPLFEEAGQIRPTVKFGELARHV